jgi:hypothetical protein
VKFFSEECVMGGTYLKWLNVSWLIERNECAWIDLHFVKVAVPLDLESGAIRDCSVVQSKVMGGADFDLDVLEHLADANAPDGAFTGHETDEVEWSFLVSVRIVDSTKDGSGLIMEVDEKLGEYSLSLEIV